MPRESENELAQSTSKHKISYFSPYLSEFLGCLVLASVYNSTRLAGYYAFTPVTVGLTLVLLTYSLGQTSGAQFNPAVSFAVGLSGRGNWNMILKYWLVQVLGCAAGVAVSCYMYGHHAKDPIGARPGFATGSAFFVEFIYTGMLCLVFLNVTLARSNNSVEAGNQYFGVAIGMTVAAATYAVGEVSGAVLNPALSVCVDAQSIFDDGVSDGVIYIFAQMMGAFVAAVTFRVLRPNEADDYETFHYNLRQLREAGVSQMKVVAEASGTFLLIFTCGMVELSDQFKLARPFGAMLTMASMNYALADVSGGYFNPAVTVAVTLSGRDKCSYLQCGVYMAVQFFVGQVAAWCYTAVYISKGGQAFPLISNAALRKYNVRAILMVQTIFTGAVAFTVLATSSDKGITTKLKRNFYSGLAIGMSLAAGAFATAKLSAGAMNPAMALGVSITDLLNDNSKFYTVLYFVGSQFLGGILGAALFRVTHAGVYRRYRHFRLDDDSELDTASPKGKRKRSIDSAQGFESDPLASSSA